MSRGAGSPKEVELLFGPFATSSEYSAAMKSVTESKHTIDYLIVGSLGRAEGRSIHNLGHRQVFAGEYPLSTGHDSSRYRKGTGYNSLTDHSPSYRSPSDSSSAPPISSVVTFKQFNSELSDFNNLPFDLRQHSRNRYRFANSEGIPLEEYS